MTFRDEAVELLAEETADAADSPMVMGNDWMFDYAVQTVAGWSDAEVERYVREGYLP